MLAAGCSKRLSSATAASAEATRMLFSTWSLYAKREQSLGRGASLGKEGALAASGREGEIAAEVGRVRKAEFFSTLPSRSRRRCLGG